MFLFAILQCQDEIIKIDKFSSDELWFFKIFWSNSMKQYVKSMKKFKKIVILDSVIFYPEHRKLLQSIAEEVVEYPSSLPENLEKQYLEHPEIFQSTRCYTELGANNTSIQLLANRVADADVIVSCWTGIPDEILRLNDQLKLIVFWTHEKSHRINLKLADELGIVVSNIPDYGNDSVAEVVFAGLFEVLTRNFPVSIGGDIFLANAILLELFRYYRKLTDNEKYTRLGKFTHHFHKLGLVKFDFEKKMLEQLIPEQTIKGKRIGFLNIPLINTVKQFADGAGFSLNTFQIGRDCDSNSAEYYAFVTENDVVFYDVAELPVAEQVKLKFLKGDKAKDVRMLQNFDFRHTEKIFGIIGLGRIGTRVARLARSLGYKVIYFSRSRKVDLEKLLDIRYVSLEELISQSDILSLHVSAHHADNLLNRCLIESMKNGAIFINTADGNAIDQKALTERLLSGELSAYLDVCPGLPRKDILGLPMNDAGDWKIKKILPKNVFAYRAGWKTQESIRVKTFKLLGQMADYLITHL
jgi:lactate dehydrogenase-like 2-hydroxyacid dehydrogenase